MIFIHSVFIFALVQNYKICRFAAKNKNNIPHAWNIVNIDGEPYHLDATWDMGNKHDYFNLTDELINLEHKAYGNMPKCRSKKANFYVQNMCSFQMEHHLMAYIDSLIKKDEHIFEFRAEERLNKSGIEKEVADHILQKLHEKGIKNFGIKIYSNKKIGVYRIEVF